MSPGGLNIEKTDAVDDDHITKHDYVKDDSPRVAHHEHHRNTPSTDSPQASPYREHGPLIDRSMTAEGFTKQAYNSGLLWPRIRHYVRAPLAEFMGTFILIMFGDGVVAQVTLSGKDGGDYQSISWGWVSTGTYFVPSMC